MPGLTYGRSIVSGFSRSLRKGLASRYPKYHGQTPCGHDEVALPESVRDLVSLILIEYE
jgi:hypothetical protein